MWWESSSIPLLVTSQAWLDPWGCHSTQPKHCCCWYSGGPAMRRRALRQHTNRHQRNALAEIAGVTKQRTASRWRISQPSAQLVGSMNDAEQKSKCASMSLFSRPLYWLVRIPDSECALDELSGTSTTPGAPYVCSYLPAVHSVSMTTHHLQPRP
jgi:hypothetical protein